MFHSDILQNCFDFSFQNCRCFSLNSVFIFQRVTTNVSHWTNFFSCPGTKLFYVFARSTGEKTTQQQQKNRSAWKLFIPSPLYHILLHTTYPRIWCYKKKNVLERLLSGTKGKLKMHDLLVLPGLWISGSVYLWSLWGIPNVLRDSYCAC